MTHKIAQEALGDVSPDRFAAMVATHIDALEEYDAHMVLFREDALNADLPADERHVAFPAPSAHAEIEAAIRRDPQENGTTVFTPDYEIVAPPPPSLAQKKAELFDLVSTHERDAIAGVLPAGKIRAYQFREQDIRKADQKRWADVDHDKFNNFEQYNYLERPPEDTKFLEEQAAREDQRNEIQRWAAQLHSDIEDLTEETIEAWEVKPFHG